MSMRISSGGVAAQDAGGAAAWQQRQQSIQALGKALQSNDLDAAKQAFKTLAANAPARAVRDAESPLAQLGKALDSGNLDAAKQVFGAISARRSRPSDSAGGTPPQAALPTATIGNHLNVVA